MSPANVFNAAPVPPETARLTISVIMPVYNGREFLVESLPPLIAMREIGEVAEVIVANDGSTDGSDTFAAELGATIVYVPGPLGPGAARNRAADVASGSLLWFVDADVIAVPGSAALITSAFRDETVDAIFGSYDDKPAAENFASQYKNLVHHYYHQLASTEASTFWAGCGIVRKSAFARVSGFDVERYKRPSIEDIDLGYRLRATGGRILLIPSLQATHLKYWTLKSIVRTDLFQRALPWSRLMLSREGLLDDLNLGKAERVRAGLVWLMFLLSASAVSGLAPWWAAAAMLAVVVAANFRLLAFFTRRKGLPFGLGALLFHQFYYVYSSAAYVWCWLERLFTKPAAQGC